MGNTNNLFSEFDSVSAKQWKQKIQVDLKGADYNETLVWESAEGIKVKPFYHSEDLETSATFALTENHSWKIGQHIYTGNAELANKKGVDVLQRGAETLIIQVPESSINIAQVLKGIDLQTTPVHFQFDFLDADFIKRLLEKTGGTSAQIHLNIDILGNLTRSGNWYHKLEKDHSLLSDIMGLSEILNTASIIQVDTTLYQNAGATIVQQLAYGLCHANEYLNHYSEKFPSSSTPVFKVAIGSNYFFEIAKLRALRWLWKLLAPAYDLATDCHILAIPSKRNKTIYDYNVNMLRTSTECMAAILGGADTVCNLPYDSIYHKDNEFGERIARNQLLLLREESHFDEAIHAANGSYYIETLTNQLVEKALDLFKQLEAGGGLLKLLQNGTIQRKIKESAEKEQKRFNSGELISVGTNKYENIEDKMSSDLELYPFVKTDKRKTIIEPIIERRLSEELEQNRLKSE